MSVSLRRVGGGVSAFLLILALTMAGAAQAGFLTADPNAMPGWSGTLSLSAAKSGASLNAAVDYAVYAPGSFDVSFPNLDPSDNTRYVYAYQIFDKSTSTASITTFTVGLNVAAQVASQEQLADPLAPAGQASATPGFTDPAPTSAVWDYTGSNNVLPTKKGEILIFTSPFAPQWASASMLATSHLSAQAPGSNGLPRQENL